MAKLDLNLYKRMEYDTHRTYKLVIGIRTVDKHDRIEWIEKIPIGNYIIKDTKDINNNPIKLLVYRITKKKYLIVDLTALGITDITKNQTLPIYEPT